MIAFLLVAQFALGSTGEAVDPTAIKALQDRGLSTSVADLSTALEAAFANRDKGLVLALTRDMMLSMRDRLFADKVICLYEALPDDDFKEDISVPVACALQRVQRVMESKWACDFYGHALGVMYGKSSKDSKAQARLFLKALSSQCGLCLAPYLVKGALTIPDDQIAIGDIFMAELVTKQWSAVTPAMAYHLLQWYTHRPGTIPNEKVYAPMRERAKPLLDAKSLPPDSSREEVLKQLDAMIETEGKRLCERYGKVPYAPAPPPLPPSPRPLLEP